MIRFVLPIAQLVGRVGIAVLDRLYPVDMHSPTGRWDR